MNTLSATLDLLSATLRVSTPLIFAALGGMFSERSGVTNIALEGMMLLGALFAAIFTLITGSPWLGLLAGASFGGISAVLYAFLVISMKANQIVIATALNMLAIGITPFICKVLYGQTGGSPTIDYAQRFTSNEPVILMLALVVVIYFWLKHTRSGLWVLFAGEHPHALETAGVSVIAVRWWAVIMSGVLAGIGGATLSLFLSSAFTREMSSGRGFIALAALILGKWNPITTVLACLLFGFTSALEMRLQGISFFGSTVPVQFIQILPYVVTVLVLAGAVGKSRAPAAVGTVFENH